MEIDPKRGTGRTTRQIRAAPPDAIFVAPSGNSVWYVEQLVRKEGRTDIEVWNLGALSPQRVQGLERAILVDHAADLTRDNMRAMDINHAMQVRRPR